MIEVLPVNNREDIEEYIKINNLTIPEPSLAMLVLDNGERAGIGALSLIDYKCVLTCVHTDESLQLMLGKSLLNMADLRGIKQVYCYDESLSDISEKLRFQKQAENGKTYFVLNLEGYFDAGCQHCN